MNFLCHIHFWTMKALSPGTATGPDTGSHKYHEKSQPGKLSVQVSVDSCRKDWAEGRGITWTPRNKKPDKLRDNLKEYEELMSLHRPVCIKWKTHKHCLVLLENGILITFTLSRHSGDVERIFIDRTLTTKLHASIDNALIVENNIILTLINDPHPICVSFSQRRTSASQISLMLKKTDSGRRLDKLSSQDPKLSSAKVGQMPIGAVSRHVLVSCEGDLLAVWWRDQEELSQQWSSGTDKGYNLILFTIESGRLDYAYGMEMTFDPICIKFSKRLNSTLLSLEKTADSTYECCSYECRKDKLDKTVSDTTVTLVGDVVVGEWDSNDANLLLACEDRTLVLVDCVSKKPPIRAQVLFSSISLIRWHPDNFLVLVCGSQGELLCYDIALNPLAFQILSETPSPTPLLEIGKHFMAGVQLNQAEWDTGPEGGDCHNFVMVLDRGPVVVLRVTVGILSQGHLGPVEMVSEYITSNQTDKAIAVLNQQNWGINPNQCFVCLTLIMDHLLTQTLSRETEGQIDLTLSFFRSISITSDAHYTYKTHVGHFARRFFHLLTRNKRLEKALEVAESMDGSLAKDLFMDVHFLAVDLSMPHLAQQAKQKAEQSSNTFASDVLQSIELTQSKRNDEYMHID